MPARNKVSTAALVLDGVRKSFPSGSGQVLALDGVSARVESGSVTGLIGPDGAGKTTLMRLIAGLLNLDGGRIEVLGTDVAESPLTVQSSIGYMPQRFGLYEDLSVQENLDLYADLQGVPVDQRHARYARLMEMTGLAPFTRRLAGKLSGGMKQKLGLACTLVRPPRLLLLDEPTVGVDPVSRRELWEIINAQVSQARMSVLLSTAYLDEAERCDQVILLHRGSLLGEETPVEFSRPLTGRTFELEVEGIPARRLQSMLAGVPGVLDVLVAGDQVRLVTEPGFHPDPATLLPEHPQLRIRETAPRFEDAFIARLKAHDGQQQRAPRVSVKVQSRSGDEVIRLHQLERRFGEFRAVKGISFSVRRGEIFGLLGANGAGKTTTFRMLCGLLPASAGELSVAGHDLRTAGARARASIGYMAQRFSLYANLTVLQNLQFFSSAYGLTGRRQRERVRWALDGFELR
ncbi:MAG TPA: ABC transporter ATP-binding protein, partial [Chromatiales bacterium]|nr:ABC transporter ATP-binding protein [Chromatiales bacterium]